MTQTFRALLLAAGLGTRLRPLTMQTPKCLVPIGGEPLLGHWLRKLELAGCDSVLVNTHYLAEQVKAFLQSWQSPRMNVSSVHEPELLGTAGTLLANQEVFQGFNRLTHSCRQLHDRRSAGFLDFPPRASGLLSAHYAYFRYENPKQLRDR